MSTPSTRPKTKASAIFVRSVCAASRTPAARETTKVATVMKVNRPTGAPVKRSSRYPSRNASAAPRAIEYSCTPMNTTSGRSRLGVEPGMFSLPMSRNRFD